MIHKKDWISKINSIALSASMVFFVIAFSLIIIQVFSRYIIKYSFPWVEELCRYTIISIVLLSSGYLLRNRENPYVEFLYEKFPARKKYILNIVQYSLITIFLIFLFINGVDSVLHSLRKKTPSLRIVWAIPYFSIPLGSLLMLLQMPFLFRQNRKENRLPQSKNGNSQ